MNIAEESLKKHFQWRGKLETVPRAAVTDTQSLSLAYTPGVAQACLEIQKKPELSFDLTRRWNTVAVVTDGTAVLGLGDIGPEAGMPVMEGKSVLFKTFGNVDAIPLCIKSKSSEEIIRCVELLSGSFGGINLEDISAPRCFEIERELKKRLDIPVFHDDQHGTAIVVGAALENALKLVGKKMGDVRAVINGAGSAGIAIAEFLLGLGIGDVAVCDRKGVLDAKTAGNDAKAEIASKTNKACVKGLLKDAMRGADVFIGVSAPNVVDEEMVRSMAKKPIVFTMSNPVPEILPEKALAAGAAVVGTGSSQYKNQINNVLAFPGIFRGALDARAHDITMDMMKAACKAIASAVDEKDLSSEYIIPYAFDKNVHALVAAAVKKAAEAEK
ncbi:MAG: NADP-dependent malic enzyme [Clostridia bacterium]|nr:NADP-dependent malic enzyme [Clostridia bacterium]